MTRRRPERNKPYKKPRAMDQHICGDKYFSIEELDNLEIETNLKCEFCVDEFAEKVFNNKSALNTHMEKKHGWTLTQDQRQYKTIAFTSKEKLMHGCECRYFCPVSDCRFSHQCGKETKIKQKGLPSFFSLKHHYIRNHKKKQYKCDKCNNSYTIKSDLDSHLINCGVDWLCKCGKSYDSRQALRKHINSQGAAGHSGVCGNSGHSSVNIAPENAENTPQPLPDQQSANWFNLSLETFEPLLLPDLCEPQDQFKQEFEEMNLNSNANISNCGVLGTDGFLQTFQISSSRQEIIPNLSLPLDSGPQQYQSPGWEHPTTSDEMVSFQQSQPWSNRSTYFQSPEAYPDPFRTFLDNASSEDFDSFLMENNDSPISGGEGEATFLASSSPISQRPQSTLTESENFDPPSNESDISSSLYSIETGLNDYQNQTNDAISNQVNSLTQLTSLLESFESPLMTEIFSSDQSYNSRVTNSIQYDCAFVFKSVP